MGRKTKGGGLTELLEIDGQRVCWYKLSGSDIYIYSDEICLNLVSTMSANRAPFLEGQNYEKGEHYCAWFETTMAALQIKAIRRIGFILNPLKHFGKAGG